MGSRRFEGVWFAVYSHDHAPPHVHARYAGARAIFEFTPDGSLQQALRPDAVIPANAKRSDIRHMLEIANQHTAELIKLWEGTHGKTGSKPDSGRAH